MDQELTAIRQTVADAEKYQNDPAPFLALHTGEVALVNIAGRRVLGRDALGEAMTAALATPLARVLTTTEIVDIRFVTAETAIVSCIKHIADGRGAGDELPARGALTYVLVKASDGWRIALAQTTPIAG